MLWIPLPSDFTGIQAVVCTLVYVESFLVEMFIFIFHPSHYWNSQNITIRARLVVFKTRRNIQKSQNLQKIDKVDFRLHKLLYNSYNQNTALFSKCFEILLVGHHHYLLEAAQSCYCWLRNICLHSSIYTGQHSF